METITIEPGVSVNGISFGCPLTTLLDELGEPDDALENYTGELEMLYGDSFYRSQANRFVECTYPDTYQFVVGDVAVVSMYEWLGAQPGFVDRARFRICLEFSMAYDFRDPAHGSITIFERGRWDYILQSQQ